MATRLLLIVPLLVGGALLAAGIVLWLRTTLSFGWFAYAPLTDVAFVPAMPAPWLSLVLAILGTAILAGWIGYLVGRHRSRRDVADH